MEGIMKNALRIILVLSIILSAYALAEDDFVQTGINVGPLPSVAYNSDTGFQYGLLANIFFYGDGKIYPDYYHNIYVEWNQTTKGAGLAQLTYDSKYLIPGIRVTADLSNVVKQAWGFYGFNGAESKYNASWVDKTSPDYKNSLYYAMKRNQLRFTLNLQGNITDKSLRWLGGVGIMNFNVGSASTTRAWDTSFVDQTTLYDDFVDLGAITATEADGGLVTYIKGGVVYDTRDNEACPMKGLWEELLMTYAPKFLGEGGGWLQLSAIHRQYFTLVPDKLSLTYRLGYQGIIAGNQPFYLQGNMPDSRNNRDGLGGSKNIRGIMGSRLVGDGYVYGNLEARWKIVRFKWIGQSWYFGINPFLDAGMVVQPYQYDKSGIEALANSSDYLTGQNETVHLAYGLGVKLAMNENMILSVDYGFAGSSNDGSTGLYIGLGYLY
jgi:outer membrane protein assembly factor BamA